jgi:4-amino-4-deoxy-L-arabinose transferase-like glycosyltransferase
MQRAEPLRRPIRSTSGRDGASWLAMFAIALVLRAGCAWLLAGTRVTPGSDAAVFDGVSWNLARGAGFTLESAAGAHPTASVPPVGPWLTSLLYRAVGHRYVAAVLLQCVIGSLMPLLIAAFGRSLFGDPVGRWSGWIATVDPLLVLFPGAWFTETTGCAALLLALFISAQWVRTPRNGRALGAGLAWGVAALTAPTALVLPAIVIVWAWRPLGLTLGGSARVRQLGLLLLGIALVVSPWTLRNATALRAFVPVTTGYGRALMEANNPATWGDPAARGGTDRASYQAALTGAFQGLDEATTDARARASAWAFIRGRPHDWPAIAAAKLARFAWPRATGEDDVASLRAGSRSVVTMRLDPLPAWSLVMLPFALWGVGRSLRGGRRWFQALPLCFILAFMPVAVVFSGSIGTRLSVEPLVALLAALGLENVRRRLVTRRRGFTVVQGRRAEPPPGGA